MLLYNKLRRTEIAFVTLFVPTRSIHAQSFSKFESRENAELYHAYYTVAARTMLQGKRESRKDPKTGIASQVGDLPPRRAQIIAPLLRISTSSESKQRILSFVSSSASTEADSQMETERRLLISVKRLLPRLGLIRGHDARSVAAHAARLFRDMDAIAYAYMRAITDAF